MSEDMAWMIVSKLGTYRRPPGGAVSFTPPVIDRPQQWPRDVVDYFVARQWAEEVPSPNREEARAINKRKTRTAK